MKNLLLLFLFKNVFEKKQEQDCGNIEGDDIFVDQIIMWHSFLIKVPIGLELEKLKIL